MNIKNKEKYEYLMNLLQNKFKGYIKNKTLIEHLKAEQEKGHCNKCDAVVSLEQTFNISRLRAERVTWKYICSLAPNFKEEWNSINTTLFIKEASFVIKSKKQNKEYPKKHTRYLLTLQQYKYFGEPKRYLVKIYFCNIHGRKTSQVQILGAIAPIDYLTALKLYEKKLKELIKKNGLPIVTRPLKTRNY